MASISRHNNRKSKTGSGTTQSVVLYARVSSKEQEEEGYSVPAQLRLLRDYAARNGLHIAAEFVEAETAKRAGRKAFDTMLRYVREQKVHAILVEKTDRLYRNFPDFVKVDELAVDLHFVKEGQVIRQDSHSSEKLMHSIKVCLAKNYVDNLSEEIRKGMAEKARQGIYPSHAPLGYINVPDGHRKKIEPDPERASLVRRIFEAYAEGQVSMADAAAFAYRIGLRTKKGHRVHKSSIDTMLKNPAYAGLIVWNGETFSGAHEPIVPMDVFKQVQDILSGRSSRLGYGTVEIAYRGLIKCPRCGSFLTGEIKKGRYVYYHCIGRRNGCDLPYVREEVLTGQFEKLLGRLSIPPDMLVLLKAALHQSSEDERRFSKEQRSRLEKEGESLRRKLTALYEDKIAGEVSGEIYRSLRERYESELEENRKQLAALDGARHHWQDEGERLLELAATASDRFKDACPNQKAELLKYLCSNCIYDGEKLHVDLREMFDLMLKATQSEPAEAEGGSPEVGQREDWWR